LVAFVLAVWPSRASAEEFETAAMSQQQSLKKGYFTGV
jgi:hypothetical protein